MSWRERAACKSDTGVEWYPTALPHTAAYRTNLEAARTLCAACDVREACLMDALADGLEQHGIRAGLTEFERLRVRRKLPLESRPGPRRQPIDHGTPAGYQTHRRRGEDPCVLCRIAHSEVGLRRRREARERKRVERFLQAGFPVPERREA